MTDNAKRLLGPTAVDVANPGTYYTVPAKTKTFIRDVTFTNPTTTDIEMRMSIGAMSSPENKVFDFTVPQLDTYSFRGLWIMDETEIIQLQQVTIPTVTWTSVVGVADSTAGTTLLSGNWTPAADTLYILTIAFATATGTETISSLTGNGTWTQITNTTSGDTAGDNDSRLASYYWYSSSAGTLAQTTVTLSGNVIGVVNIDSVSGVYKTGTSNNYPTYLPVQSATNSDSTVSSGSTASGLGVTFGSALRGGILFGANARATNTNSGETSTPPTGFTELSDRTANTGGVAPACDLTTYAVTTPPATTTTFAGANTYSTARTGGRNAVAIEFAPSGVVNVMVNGIEVLS